MAEGRTLTLYKFTNHPDSQYLDDLLAIFYRGVDANTVGVMSAFNTQTEEEELILVGIQLDKDNKPECFPLAKVLTHEDVLDYLAPDGKGGYFDMTNPEEVEASKENMKAAPR
jgi:hypothetical protein